MWEVVSARNKNLCDGVTTTLRAPVPLPKYTYPRVLRRALSIANIDSEASVSLAEYMTREKVRSAANVYRPALFGKFKHNIAMMNGIHRMRFEMMPYFGSIEASDLAILRSGCLG